MVFPEPCIELEWMNPKKCTTYPMSWPKQRSVTRHNHRHKRNGARREAPYATNLLMDFLREIFWLDFGAEILALRVLSPRFCLRFCRKYFIADFIAEILLLRFSRSDFLNEILLLRFCHQVFVNKILSTRSKMISFHCLLANFLLQKIKMQ